MAGNFDVRHMPAMNEQSFLEMEPSEKRLVRRNLSAEQVDNLLKSGPFRAYVAHVKFMALTAQNEFFSGVEVPPGVTDRTSYYTGLVNMARRVVDLQRQLWLASRTPEEPEPKEKPVEFEKNLFDGQPVEQLSGERHAEP